MAETLIRSTDDLVAAWRARIRELNLTYAMVDEISGLPDRYTSKLMCGSKKPGGLSITLMNQALGMALVSVVDEVQADRVRSKWEPRKRPLFDATPKRALLTIASSATLPAANALDPEDAVAGITVHDCCSGCGPTGCMITAGANRCGHPQKSGLPPELYNDRVVRSFYQAARDEIAAQIAGDDDDDDNEEGVAA